MKVKKYILLSVFLGLARLVVAQSLTFDDLVNLQKCNLDKAKDFFSYAGFTWHSSHSNKQNYEAGGYPLYNDEVEWRRGSESIKCLYSAGFDNILIYYAEKYSFEQLESVAKTNLSRSESQTRNNQLSSSYSNGSLRMTFIAERQSGYYSTKTNYMVLVDNEPDIRRRIGSLCKYCKATGQIVEFEKCSSCKGNGRQGCYSCSGQGKTNCQYCKQGYKQCGTCWGKGTNTCGTCWGKGTTTCGKCYGSGEYTCNSCYGQGTYSCTACYGQGKLSQTLLGQSFYAPCPGCLAKGKLTCSSCSGRGKITCSGCSGNGSLDCKQCSAKGLKTCNACSGSAKSTCGYCAGNYSSACQKCSGTGYTNVACGYCNGKGVTSHQIRKVCPMCNGTKVK